MGHPGRRRGVRHAGAPASAAAALALLIQENGMLFSRPLAFIGTNARKTIPAATFLKRPPVPRHAIAAALDDGRYMRRAIATARRDAPTPPPRRTRPPS